jgi:tetratricopeptide (TPR) repeat protein
LAGLLVKRPSLTVGLWGSPGIGKTFAAQRLLQETPCRNLSLHATTSPSSLALALPRPKKLPTWAERILEKLELDEFVETSTIIDALGAILTGLAPFVLHLEDVHEVAPDQLEFIQNLARVVQRLKGVGLIITSRTEPPEPFEIVLLQALSGEEVKAMLEREAGAPLPEESIEWIQSRAAGNPLYTLEFFRFLARQGFVWNDGKHWHWRKPDREVMPVTVEALIEQQLRYATNTPALRDALGAKAMLPIGSSDALWAAVTDAPLAVLEEIRLELVRSGAIMRGEFAHPLYREVTRQNLSVEQRMAFARRAVAALESEHPEEAAGLVEDAALEPATALEVLESIALRLEHSGDSARAALALSQATRFTTGEARGQIALRAVRGLGNRADTAHLAALTELVVTSLPDSAQHTEALLTLAERHAREGHHQELHAVLARLPQQVQNGPQWMMRHIHILFDSGNYDQVLTVWQAHPEWQQLCSAETCHRVAHALVESGDLEAAKSLALETLERPGLSDLDRAGQLDILGMVAFYAGRYAEAEAYFSDVIEAYKRGNDERSLVNALRNRSVNRLQLGLYIESLPDFEESMRVYVSWGASVGVAQTQIMVSAVFLELGNYERAERTLLEGIEVMRRIPPQPFLVYGLVGLALLYTRWNPPYSATLASKYAQDALGIAHTLGNPVLLANALQGASVVETWLDRPLRGLELADASLVHAQKIGFNEAIINSHAARGDALSKMGQVPEALEALREATRLCAETGLVLEVHKVGLELAHLERDLEAARAHLAWFEVRGLMNGVSIAHEHFPRLASGERSSPALNSSPDLRLEFLGPIRFSIRDKPETVRGRKRQELLALLLEARIAGRSEVGKLELLEALYPDSGEEQATNALQETVRATRSSLGADVIVTTANGYALGAVTSDAEAFLKSGNTNLWRGAYLDGLTVETRDDTVRESLHLALFAAATAALETDSREAARVGRILLDFDGYNLEYLELCIKALRATSNHKSLTRLYMETRDRLSEVGEVIPERWQGFLERTALKA